VLRVVSERVIRQESSGSVEVVVDRVTKQAALVALERAVKVVAVAVDLRL
jgi:hypothetical protein